jgi:hypothetical protein
MTMQTHAAKRTTDHEIIERWVEERQGRPSVVEATWDGTRGLLRIDFGEESEVLTEISWEDFFRIFDESNIEFLYQEETTDGGISRFHRFLEKEEDEA